jgi:hypothetical protein
MAYTTITKSSSFMNTKLYTGNGSNGLSISGVGFQPDLVWLKSRSAGSTEHHLMDVLRGWGTGSTDTPNISSNSNGASYNRNIFSSNNVNSDGFELNDYSDTNANGGSFVSWNWKANGSSTVANNDGATTSNISHNSTAQFSIITYAGTGSATNIGHGLNGKPDCFITKAIDSSDWHMWNNSFGANDRIKINSTGAATSNTSIFPTVPDATKIYFGGGGDVNGSGVNYICYAWKNVPGFSQAGKYVGNGNATNSAFIYTGFKPKFVIIKVTSESDSWFMHDDKRDGYNDDNEYLFPDLTNAEGSNVNRIRLLSNGFQLPTTDKSHNKDGATYIYLAFGQTIVGTNNVPATAR